MMIDSMIIDDVLTEDEHYTTVTVSASDIEFFMPERYTKLVEIADRFQYQVGFFFLACEYIQSLDNVRSTDCAKIGAWYPT